LGIVGVGIFTALAPLLLPNRKCQSIESCNVKEQNKRQNL